MPMEIDAQIPHKLAMALFRREKIARASVGDRTSSQNGTCRSVVERSRQHEMFGKGLRSDLLKAGSKHGHK